MGSTSGLDRQIQSLTSSMNSMKACVATLLEFLHKVQHGEVPPNPTLLRHVHGLLCQLPIVTNPTQLSEELGTGYSDALILSYLAVVTKPANVV